MAVYSNYGFHLLIFIYSCLCHLLISILRTTTTSTLCRCRLLSRCPPLIWPNLAFAWPSLAQSVSWLAALLARARNFINLIYSWWSLWHDELMPAQLSTPTQPQPLSPTHLDMSFCVCELHWLFAPGSALFCPIDHQLSPGHCAKINIIFAFYALILVCYCRNAAIV